MSTVVTNSKAIAKVIVAAVGFILAALNDHIDVVPVQYRGLVTGAIALLTLFGVYQAPHGQLSFTRRSAKRSGGRKRAPAAKPVQSSHDQSAE